MLVLLLEVLRLLSSGMMASILVLVYEANRQSRLPLLK